MAGPANNGGRRRSAKNYKNEVLTNIIAGILPNGQYASWDQLAAANDHGRPEEALGQNFVQWDEEAHRRNWGER
jgi:hypothetical protein